MNETFLLVLIITILQIEVYQTLLVTAESDGLPLSHSRILSRILNYRRGPANRGTFSYDRHHENKGRWDDFRSAPPTPDYSQKHMQIDYLVRYGYLEQCYTTPDEDCFDRKGRTVSNKEQLFIAAVRRFQRTWNMAETGVVDAPTIRFMSMPRCGNDDSGLINRGRNKRFVTVRPWKQLSLTYRFTAYPRNTDTSLTDADVESIHLQAFQLWANQSGINITKGNNLQPADIEIGWYTGDHYSGQPFEGGTYAQSYFPPVGYLHYNDAQVFSKECCQSNSWHLLQVATHETGHLLGLDHTHNPASIMFPFYQRNMETVKIYPDDIQGVVTMYGRFGAVATTTTQRATTTAEFLPEEFCPDSGLSRGIGIDAVMATKTGNVMFFRGNLVALVDDLGVMDGYPRRITEVFPGFSGKIDCAVYLPVLYQRRYCSDARNCFDVLDEGGTYLFQGNRYFLYQDGRLASSSYIFMKFEGLPSPVNAAFTRKDSRIYFLVGEDLYAMEREQVNKRYQLVENYPVKFPDFYPALLGEAITDATLVAYYESDGLVLFNYFFTAKNYYRFRELDRKVDDPDPNKPLYPRPLDPWWLNCPGETEVNTEGQLEQSERIIAGLQSFFKKPDGEYVPVDSIDSIRDSLGEFAGSSRLCIVTKTIVTAVMFTWKLNSVL